MSPSSQSGPLELARLFYGDPAKLGHFTSVSADAMPAVYRRLLAHEEHMTVTVEAFHRDRVDVEVLDRQSSPEFYSRKILLRRQGDGRVVQFGIPRLRLSCVAHDVRREIESERIPLGRVLIEHDVLRQVELLALWKVIPGPDLQQLFELAGPTETYGRSALLRLHGEPAVELLEIVAPE